MDEILKEYVLWKVINERLVAVSDQFSFGKARILVDLDYAGYEQAY
jgi:hypothetical protein